MPLSEKMIKDIVNKNRKYLDALEASDKKGKKPALRKVRKNFTVDENTFLDFQKKCIQKKISMSSVIEELMKGF